MKGCKFCAEQGNLSVCVFFGHMKNSCLLTFISLVYGILIFGLPMLFVHWKSFVLAFGAVEKDSIFGDRGGN